jgi:hypothetical protein
MEFILLAVVTSQDITSLQNGSDIAIQGNNRYSQSELYETQTHCW